MENSGLSLVQNEILKALEALGEKAKLTDAIVAKKIRENCKMDGKKKAGIGLADLETALKVLEEKQIFYGITINSTNDILLEKINEKKELSSEARQRRLRSEKSLTIFTSSDFSKKDKKSVQKNALRSERKKINVRDVEW